MLKFIVLVTAVGAVACHDPVCQHLNNSQVTQAKACGDTPPTAQELATCDKGMSQCTPGDKAILEDVAACFDLIKGCGSDSPDGGGLFDSAALSCGFKAIAVSENCRNATSGTSMASDAGPTSPFSGHFSGSGSNHILCTNGTDDNNSEFLIYNFTVDGNTLTYDADSTECQGVVADISGNVATIREHMCTITHGVSKAQHWIINGTFTAHDGSLDVNVHNAVTFEGSTTKCTGDETGTLTP